MCRLAFAWLWRGQFTYFCVAIPTTSAERCYHGFNGQKQRAAVRWIFDEFGAGEIEALGMLAFRLHQHCTNTDALRSECDPPQSICIYNVNTPTGA